MSKNAWIIFAVAVVVLFGGIILLSKKDNVDVGSVNPAVVQQASEASGNIADHVYGKADSKVVLIEYGDFQCPGCGGAYPNISRIKETYKEQLAFVFRNFPLTSIHPNAKAASAAAEAAGLQGKFWEMHNALYENQDAWTNANASTRTETFASYASAIGVKDMDKYNADLTAANVANKLAFDRSVGSKIGVTGTPTIVLNGEKVDEETINDAISGDGAKLEAKIKELFKQNNIDLPKKN